MTARSIITVWLLGITGCASLLGGSSTTTDGGASVDADPLAPDAAADAAPLVDAMPGTLALAELAPVRIRRGDQVVVTVEVSRGAGVSGPVTVSATGLPAGVSADDIVIAAGASSGELVLVASPAAAQAMTMATVHASLDELADEQALQVTVPAPSGQPVASWGQGGVVTLPDPTYGHLVVDSGDVLRTVGVEFQLDELVLFAVDAGGEVERVASGHPVSGSPLRALAARPGGGWVVSLKIQATISLVGFDAAGQAVAGFGYEASEPLLEDTPLVRFGAGFALVRQDLSLPGNPVLRRTAANGALDAAWVIPFGASGGHAVRSAAAAGEHLYLGGWSSNGLAWVGHATSTGTVTSILGAGATAGRTVDALAVTPEGHVVLAIADRAFPNGTPIAMRKLSSAGQLLLTYDGSTALTSAVTGLVAMPDGRVVVSTLDHVARFGADGHLDPSFGQGGVVDLGATVGNQQILAMRGGTGAVYVMIGTQSAFDNRIIKLTND
jgi:hypothetical protein